jgi:D-xylose transport system permease protein
MSNETLRAIDRSDERVRHEDSIGGAIRAFFGRIRSGDLGMLPVAVGLVVISIVFTSLNPLFLQPNNLVNLLFDCATIGVISLGVVCVLLLGEIDLSVGSMSGLASAIVGVMWVNMGVPLPVAILTAVACGALVGAVYATLLNWIGMPSFVSTLAGLLALLGMQLYLLGNTGSINLSYTSAFVQFGQLMVMPDWLSHLVALLPGIIMLLTGTRTARRRRAVGLSVQPRGVPWMFGLFVLLVVILDYALTRTRWGRSMFAVGGNREAARRVGINVKRVCLTAFVLCSSLAALGGLLSAARLASSSQQAGTGDVNLNAIAAAVIGGTSLFGGRGSAYSALLGIIVIQAISNGLTLLNLPSSLRYMITGGVLAIAVIVDSLARRSRAAHGRS